MVLKMDKFSNGDKWRSHRKMLTPSFHFKILDDFLPVMTRQTRIFVKVLNKAVEKNNGVISDISTPILNCALDTICGKYCDQDVIHPLITVITDSQRPPWA